MHRLADLLMCPCVRDALRHRCATRRGGDLRTPSADASVLPRCVFPLLERPGTDRSQHRERCESEEHSVVDRAVQGVVTRLPCSLQRAKARSWMHQSQHDSRVHLPGRKPYEYYSDTWPQRGRSRGRSRRSRTRLPRVIATLSRLQPPGAMGCDTESRHTVAVWRADREGRRVKTPAPLVADP